ncbi:beta-glucosidase [Roseomonas sp. BU-1]|uniref:Beta-glucosidase n=1 Tax=Falsiroseomonas selenitidurans TaxID=2716335 RepID=A0ABX1EB15_9PROT|nr:beta-glucosidase [Falsiroseomonas selenitidurans]
MPPPLFRSFFLAGFECSSHRNMARRRLDMIAATRHDLLAREDYAQLAEHGIRSVRDGLRWHLIETQPGRHDWTSLLPMLRAAEATGTQVMWDLCHYGWPDDLDVFAPAFVDRFARFAAAFARLHVEETGRAPFTCPVNEMSFIAFSGGDMARSSPHATGRGLELKRNLVRATVAATRAVRAEAPAARFACIDPLIHIVPRHAGEAAEVRAHNASQWQAWDMLAGREAPELGGAEDLLDVVGVNYYWNNQWLNHAEPLSVFDSARYRPFRHLLAEAAARYAGRQIFVAETSIEGAPRPAWLRYVTEEALAAAALGVPVEGVCLYPVVSHDGWDEDRYCENGLFEATPLHGRRQVHRPLAEELARLQAMVGHQLIPRPAHSVALP